MHPIERLRYIARSGESDPLLLAEEAAFALRSLSVEPRALVPACRRLVSFHPTCGPLWWVASRILCAGDPAAEADRVVEELLYDPTKDELAASFPGASVIATVPGAHCLSALNERPDLSIRVVGTPFELRHFLARFDLSPDVSGYLLDEVSDALFGAGIVLLEALAAGPAGFLFDSSSAAVASLAAMEGIDLWVATGVGCTLPGPLFDAVVSLHKQRSARLESVSTADVRSYRASGFLDPFASFAPAEIAACVVSPFGPLKASDALRQPGCLLAEELLVDIDV